MFLFLTLLEHLSESINIDLCICNSFKSAFWSIWPTFISFTFYLQLQFIIFIIMCQLLPLLIICYPLGKTYHPKTFTTGYPWWRRVGFPDQSDNSRRWCHSSHPQISNRQERRSRCSCNGLIKVKNSAINIIIII